ncbi:MULTISPECIES: Hpt domain-containing protein [unclassified Pseudomonas]|uniref:Hpt domain-containing protein n=1 Tax=unclassified Pseudomonas TaxID=196821 RepID=UPI0002A401F6|nr:MULTISPECIES: Hpt domain-containing protein [unclassified Pseudomonas]MBB1608206.1 histidine kinase [Pseudomonas sp. UMC76]MBB1639250.1 histidine kinase [Pseudomonas sp. UME83]NTX88732.1 response regulator [Pseudomonas sp. UMA643]NTY19326.1 response regulator [Pseudomonas sp. UMC3103]NTY24645.1 response regulator [Pseudomonas sp. UMA603]
MGDRHDYVALEWVKGEIAETLKQARQALEAFVENPQDPTRMGFCLAHVHQVRGTLQMVEFYGAALLAEEMEQLTQALIDQRVPSQGEALEVLMQAILQLPVYLDRIQSARRDLPMVVLPLLNDLRAARGEKLLSETSLFAPDLSGGKPLLPHDALARLRTSELPTLLRKLRQMLQVALVGVIRNQDLPTNLGYMARVFARLESLCKEAPLGRLWTIASAMVEGLANGSIANGTTVRNLLRQVDREFKRLVEEGADGMNQAAPDELVKNLLFYVAKASDQSPKVREVKDEYRLDEALPGAAVVDEERARLAGPDRDAMRSVVGALCEELVRVKDSLDLFVRSDRSSVADLQALVTPLKQIADTLAVLGFGQPRRVILDQLEVVGALADRRREPSDATLMDVAGALLYVEATLAGMAGPSEDHGDEESRLPTTDVAQIHQVVIKEARNGLELAKDAIIEFIASQWNHEHLARVPELLTQVRGGLEMIDQGRAARLLEACNRYIQEQLLARQAVPDWHSLDTLADAITGVEYYLERLSEDQGSSGELILDVAEESLEQLGYPLKPRPSILDMPTPDAPADEALAEIDLLASSAAADVLAEQGVVDELQAPDDIVPEAAQAFAAEPGWESANAGDLAQPGDELAWDLPATEEAAPIREDVEASLLVSDDNWTLAEPETPALDDAGVDFSLDAPLESPAEPVEPSWSLDESLSLDSLEPLPGSEVAPAAPGLAAAGDSWTLDDLPALDAAASPAAAEGEIQWTLDEETPSTSDTSWSLDDLPALDAGAEPQTNPSAPASELEWDLAFDAPQPGDSAPGLGEWSLEPLADEPPASDELPALELDAPFDAPGSSLEELPELAAPDLDEAPASEQPSAADQAWEDLDMAALDLPEVELPSPPIEPEAEPEEAKPLSLAEVMATPAQAINPPAREVPPSLLPPPADEEPVDEELREVFIEEAGEVLETINEYLPRWQADVDDREALTEIRRAFHTLKGSGRMVRALVVGELAWSIENLLNRVLDRSIAASAPVLQVVGDVVALMPSLVDEFAASAQRQRDDVDQLAATAHALAKGEPVPPPEGGETPAVEEVALEPAVEAAVLDEGLDPQLLEIFRNEAEAHLETLGGFLADCDRELPQPVTDDLQRALHTLKGSAHMAGILPIAEIATPLERLVKEFKTNLLQVDLREAELLREAERLLRVGLQQLDAGRPLAHIDGGDELLQRIAQVQQERLEAAEAKRRGESGESGGDPQMLSLFLAEGMNILLDAEDLLGRWREHPHEGQELGALHEELATLAKGAQQAELPQMAELCEALLAVYGAVQQGRLAVSDDFFGAAEDAHEALIGMMDQVAAALQVSACPQQVEALQRLLQAPAVEADEAPVSVQAEADGESDLIDLDQLTADDFPLEDEELLLDRPTAPEDLPEDLQWSAAPPPAEAQEPTPVEPEDVRAANPVQTLDEEMVAIFLEEAVDILDSAGQALAQWSQAPETPAPLSTLQRDLHTLKGGARMAEIREIGDLSHELESLYEGLLDQRFQAGPGLAGLLQACHDCLAQQLDQLQAGQPLTDPDALIQRIRAFRQNPETALTAAPAEPQPEAEAEAEPLADEPPLPIVDESESEPEPEPEQEPETEGTAPEAVDPVLEEIDLATFLHEAESDPSAQALEQSDDVEPAAEPAFEPLEVHDQELVDIFLEEGFDILESAAGALQRWMGNVDNGVELEALQRDLHTLKGGARMAEIRPIGDLAHELEYLYEGLCGGRLRASDGLFALLQRCHDRLAEMLEAVQGRRPVPEGESLIAAIRDFRANPDEQLSMPSSVSLQPLVPSLLAGDEPAADIIDIFLEEADDLLEGMEHALGRWDADGDHGALDELLRILHTLKGGARLAGQNALGDLAHDLEEHLTEAQRQGAPWPDSLLLDVQSGFDGLQNEVDHLRQQVGEADAAAESAEAVTPPPASEPEPVEPPLPVLAAGAIMAVAEPPRSEAPKVLPFVQRAQEAAQQAAARRAPQELVKVPAPLLENLVNLAGETSIFRGRVEQQVSDVGSTLTEMDATIERVRDQLRRLDTETQAQILSRHQADAERAGYEDFDPLEMDRYSQLQQLSRALFESASDLFDLKETLAAKNRDAETLLLQQARVNTELQEGLMRTRMVPFDRLVPRLRRIVRQVAGELGKQVEFIVGNAEGEMDRTVLERIVAPLEHMLRNAVDHGIESADARRAAGKPEAGSIRLELGREGGDILLSLADDGGGIRLDAVRRKAVERGLMAADAELSDHEVLQFILEAGFSTAEKLTQISGRGVGLDVVNAEVKQLGGSMSIHSETGQGTRFAIRLPFTVSVNRALMVLSGEDLYAVPLNTIEGIVRVSPYELEALYEEGGRQGHAPHFEYAGQDYELKYLGDLLNNGQQPKLVGQSLPLPVILVRSAEHAVAVQVDALAGSREIVVKSLGAQFAGVSGISGATILGDGRVVVILDLLATIRARLASLALHAQPRRALPNAPQADSEQQRPTLVMVVDDSVTVRKVTSRLLERNGMNVLTAKDGVDAIAQLQEHKPDIMLLDIEMPRMDGFEVATLVRHDERLKDLPIIMITSRTGEKHRERALAIGVNRYLGKPYQESELLDSIQALVTVHA